MNTEERTLRRAPGEGLKDRLSYLRVRVKSRLLNQCGFYRELHGMTVTTDTVNGSSATVDDDYTCRFMAADELRQIADDEVYLMSSEFIEDALARGDRCYGIFDGDKLASYGWYTSTGPNQFNEELEIVFDPGWVYMYRGYTLPEYRGQKLHAAGMSRALAAVTAEGQEGLISCVDGLNGPSLRSCARMGYRIFGSVKVCRWFAAEWVRLGPLSRYRVQASGDCNLFGFDVIAGQSASVR